MVIKNFTWFFVFLLLILTPLYLSNWFPFAFGWVEGRTNTMLTPEGRCRLDNPRETIRKGGQFLVFGYLIEPGKSKKQPHVWGLDSDNEIIDITCPVSNFACQNRKPFAQIWIQPDQVSLDVIKTFEPYGIEEKKLIVKNQPLIEGILSGQAARKR